AGGEEAVDRAVAPVRAALRIALGRRRVGLAGRAALARGARTGDREQRQRARADEERAQAGEEAAARAAPREPPRELRDEPIRPPHASPRPVARACRARYSCIDATPCARASQRLSRCSRELTRPRARTTPSASSSTACGRLPTR